jgi:hypothetical protein
VTLKVIHSYITDNADVVVIAHVGGDGINGPSTLTFHLENDRVATMRVTT